MSYDRKGVTWQAPPMEVGLVKGLEVAVRTPRNATDRSVAGFALFVLLARARLTDAARADGEPTLDLDDSGDGYVEVKTTGKKVKTGRGKRCRLRLLPMVANANGVTGRPWAQWWLDARRECHQDVGADGCLQQALGPLGFRPGTVMGTTEMMSHVRRLLRATGAPQRMLANKTSHSLKATCLSWAAKAALPVETRRILGGHAQPGDVSVLEYSRDAMAGPLKALDGVIAQIRDGRFDPDQTRSGRWKSVPEAAEEETSDAPTEGRELGCTCGATDPLVETRSLRGAKLFRCAQCDRRWTEMSAWNSNETERWLEHFPEVKRHGAESDADSEREEGRPTAKADERTAADSACSSSDVAPLTPDEDPGTGDEEGVTIRAVALLPGDRSDNSETTDAEEAWVNPMYWDLGLARHRSWFTVRAVITQDMLLCGRVLDSSYERVVNPPDSFPVCRVCRARIRGRVENARHAAARDETARTGNIDESEAEDDEETQQSEPETPCSGLDCEP